MRAHEITAYPIKDVVLRDTNDEVTETARVRRVRYKEAPTRFWIDRIRIIQEDDSMKQMPGRIVIQDGHVVSNNMPSIIKRRYAAFIHQIIQTALKDIDAKQKRGHWAYRP